MVNVFDVYRFSQKENRLTALLALALESEIKIQKEFLTIIDEDITFDKFSISLQEREEESIPDATIYINGRKSFFIESKLGSDVNENQLYGHINSGRKNIHLICITGGVSKPSGVIEAEKRPEYENLITWLSWRQIYRVFKNLDEEHTQSTHILSLLSALEMDNLVGFTGYRTEELKDVSDFVTRYETTLSKTDQLIDDIESSLNSINKEIIRTKFVRDGRATNSLDTVTYCDYAFSFRTWEDCGYDSTRNWVRESGSIAVITINFYEEMIYLWGRAAFNSLENVEEKWEPIFEDINNNGFTIELLTEEGKDFEELSTQTALEKVKDEKVKVMNFSKSYLFADSLIGNPTLIIDNFSSDIYKILTILRNNNLFSTK